MQFGLINHGYRHDFFVHTSFFVFFVSTLNFRLLTTFKNILMQFYKTTQYENEPTIKCFLVHEIHVSFNYSPNEILSFQLSRTQYYYCRHTLRIFDKARLDLLCIYFMKITVTQFRINYCHYISKSSIKNLCLADVEQLKIIYFSIFHSIQSIFPGINSTGTDKRCKSYVPILKLYMEYYGCYSLYLVFNYSCRFSGLYTRTETVNIRGQMK